MAVTVPPYQLAAVEQEESSPVGSVETSEADGRDEEEGDLACYPLPVSAEEEGRSSSLEGESWICPVAGLGGLEEEWEEEWR